MLNFGNCASLNYVVSLKIAFLRQLPSPIFYGVLHVFMTPGPGFTLLSAIGSQQSRLVDQSREFTIYC